MEPELSFALGALLHFPENKPHIFLLAGAAKGGCLPPARRQPSCFPPLPTLPEVAGATSWDGFLGARELSTARGCAVAADATHCLRVGFCKGSVVSSRFSGMPLRRSVSPGSWEEAPTWALM